MVIMDADVSKILDHHAPNVTLHDLTGLIPSFAHVTFKYKLVRDKSENDANVEALEMAFDIKSFRTTGYMIQFVLDMFRMLKAKDYDVTEMLDEVKITFWF
jgi:hypothetical protein